MTVSLARRLTWEGVVAPEDANAALYRHVTERVSFLQGLAERRPELVERLEAELGKPSDPGAAPLAFDAALVDALPKGLALALAAIPIRRDPVSAVVHVMAAHATDGHVASEFSYHLGAPVEVSVAPLRAILDALAESAGGDASRRLTPALGTKAPGAASLPEPSRTLLRPSERPIPLVRRSVEPAPPSTARHGSLAPPAPAVQKTTRTASLAPLPMISLTSTRPLGTPTAAPRAALPPTVAAVPPDVAPPAALVESAASALEDLAQATTAEEVVSALIAGLATVASTVVVLTARGKSFEGRDTNDARLRDRVRGLLIPVDGPSIVQMAVQSLGYVGPVPTTPVHAALADVLGNPQGEVAVGAVMVSGRAALVYVAAGLVTTYLATRRGDQLAENAGKALARILRERKK